MPPRTFGNPGNYDLMKARQHGLRFFMIILMTAMAVCYLAGLSTGLSLINSKLLSFICMVLPASLLFLARRRFNRILDALQAASLAFRKGADGEGLTADDLSNLPETYSVFHDVTHPSIGGNIDHIVVGPTGVFALETKNWRGMVTLSGPGNITVDGKHDKSKDGKAVLARAAELKKKIEALSNISTFVQAVMVFPNASVSVQPETRCALTVLRLDRLEEYIKRPSSRALSAQQVDAVTSDLQALFKAGKTQATNTGSV